MGKVYRGDIGLKIGIETNTDLTDAILAKIKVKKPSGIETEWNADFEDKAAGKIYYIVQEGDLDEAGLYKLQAYCEFTDGSKLYGDTVSFVVHDKYE